MKVSTLRALLEGYDDELEVMVTHQPNWPLAEVVARVIADSERDVHDDASDAEDDGEELDDCVWLVLGGHDYKRSPYGPRDVFERF